jgi:DNA-binding CsgD family transcriptional regulator
VYRERYAERPIGKPAAIWNHAAMASTLRSPPSFTERQRQVVALIAAGCSNVEIAARLGVSPRTAKAHCDALRSKLGVGRRRQIPLAYRSLTGRDPLDLG